MEVCVNVVDVNAVSTIIDLSLSLSEKGGEGFSMVFMLFILFSS